MTTDTEVTEQEQIFEEQFGDLVSQRKEALQEMKYNKDTGLRSGVNLARVRADKSYANMVSLAVGYLSEKDPTERATLLDQMGKIGINKSFYGIESVGFNPDKFKEDVQNVLEAAKEQEKEPSPV